MNKKIVVAIEEQKLKKELDNFKTICNSLNKAIKLSEEISNKEIRSLKYN